MECTKIRKAEERRSRLDQFEQIHRRYNVRRNKPYKPYRFPREDDLLIDTTVTVIHQVEMHLVVEAVVEAEAEASLKRLIQS